MAVQDRLFTHDIGVVALYADAALPSTPPGLLVDLITMFLTCSLHGRTESDNGRAISESVMRKLPYAVEYTIDVGAVVDATFPTLFYIYLLYGPGPYWVWLQLQGGDPTLLTDSFVTRAIIDNVDLTSQGEMDAQNMTLSVIQPFQPYGATNKIG